MIKTIILLIVIAILGTFIYLKLQVSGDPNSTFNQSTRYTLGKHPWLRTIFSLRSFGDARAEFFSGSGPIIIEWFKPQTEDMDFSGVLDKFSQAVAGYTGREVKVTRSGSVDDSTLAIANLAVYKLNASVKESGGGSALLVFFTFDYSPRDNNELSATYEETGMVIALTAHKKFAQDYSQDLNTYLLSSLSHEFGHQIGLSHNTDPKCIMSLHAGIDGKPLESYGRTTPQDFCQVEKEQIANLKLQFGN